MPASQNVSFGKGLLARLLLHVPVMILLVLFFASCATTRNMLPEQADPLNYLPRGAALYARLSKEAVRDFAPDLIPGDRSGAFRPFIERTHSAALGTTPAGPAGMNYDLAVIGDFSKTTVNLALAVNPEWRAEGQTFTNDPSGITVAVPVDRLLLARSIRTSVPGAREEAMGSPSSLHRRVAGFIPGGSTPLPPRFAAPYTDDVFIWIADPVVAFAEYLPQDGFDIPLLGIAITGNRTDKSDGSGGNFYRSTISFIMKDAESVRIYRPSLKFVWFALSKAFIPHNDTIAKDTDAKFTMEGDSYAAKEIMIPSETFATLFSISL